MKPAGARGDWFVSAGMGAGGSAWQGPDWEEVRSAGGKIWGLKISTLRMDIDVPPWKHCTAHFFFSLIAVIYGTE